MCCVLVVNVLMDSLVGCAAAWIFHCGLCLGVKFLCVPCALICVCVFAMFTRLYPRHPGIQAVRSARFSVHPKHLK